MPVPAVRLLLGAKWLARFAFCVNARGYYYPPMAEAMFQRSLHTDADGRFALALPGRGFPLEFRIEHAGREGATEWREAEAAGNGGGDVLLVLR